MGFLQVAISYSRGSSQPRDWTCVSYRFNHKILNATVLVFYWSQVLIPSAYTIIRTSSWTPWSPFNTSFTYPLLHVGIQSSNLSSLSFLCCPFPTPLPYFSSAPNFPPDSNPTLFQALAQVHLFFFFKSKTLNWEVAVPLMEKAMAPHSSTLAWKITWTEEPGRLQSMGSLGVGHHWATSLSLFTFLHWRRKWQPTPVFLPGESQGQEAWGAAVNGVTQSWTWLKRLSSSSSPPEQPRNGAIYWLYQFREDEPQKCANSCSVLGFSLIVYSMLYPLSHCSQQLHTIDCQCLLMCRSMDCLDF